MEIIGNILNTGSEGISKLRTKNPLTWLMLFNPFSNLTALAQNQTIPSVAITIKRNITGLRKPFLMLFFSDLLGLLILSDLLDLLDFLDFLYLLQQQDIQMTRLNIILSCF